MNLEGIKTIRDYDELNKLNAKAVDKYLSKDYSNLVSLFNIVLKYSLPLFRYDNHLNLDENTRERIILNCHHSINYLFEGIFSLMRIGNYVSIRPIQRQIYEFLIVSGHLSTNKDDKYIAWWLEGKDVKIVKRILKRITHPDSNVLITFWVELSQLNHASNATSQPDIEWFNNIDSSVESCTLTYVLIQLHYQNMKCRIFPLIQNTFSEIGKPIKTPFKSDWFTKKNPFAELHTNEMENLIKAFNYNWTIK